MKRSPSGLASRLLPGAALALCVAGALLVGTTRASDSEAAPDRALVARATGAAAPRPRADASSYRYGWPVEPFWAQHPVRGYFGDPRIANHGLSRQFHFGVDVSAPDGTPVYATITGRVRIHPLHETTVLVDAPGGVEFSYWHVVPTVRAGQRAVAYRTVIGRIEAPYAHVHFSEARDGRYLNPLRPGAMGPYVDHTRPTITAVLVERDGRQLQASVLQGAFDLVGEVRDETPIPIPRPWHGLPVTPALVRWRLIAEGRVLIGWRTAADFRTTIPPASEFGGVWAPGTTQNHVRAPGRYRIYLSRGLSTLRPGVYVVEVAVRDTRENSSSLRVPLTVRPG